MVKASVIIKLIKMKAFISERNDIIIDAEKKNEIREEILDITGPCDKYIKKIIPKVNYNIVQYLEGLNNHIANLLELKTKKVILLAITNIMNEIDDLISILKEIDVFDFESYPKESELFSRYYKDVEYMLRLAIFLDYKYNHIKDKSERLELDAEANTKQYLKDLTDMFDTEKFLERFYEHYNPERMEDIDSIAKKYIYCEDIMFGRLYKKYVDDDYKPVPLWFHDERGDERMNT